MKTLIRRMAYSIHFTLALTMLSGTVLAATPINLTMHKNPSCGCCEAYAKYLQKNGFHVKTINHDNMTPIKTRLGTMQAASCHTMEVNGYVVEGHVPVAAIKKMLRERPNIKGIALPGMPASSPGMGAEKPGSLNVMQIEHNGKADKLYQRL